MSTNQSEMAAAVVLHSKRYSKSSIATVRYCCCSPPLALVTLVAALMVGAAVVLDPVEAWGSVDVRRTTTMSLQSKPRSRWLFHSSGRSLQQHDNSISTTRCSSSGSLPLAWQSASLDNSIGRKSAAVVLYMASSNDGGSGSTKKKRRRKQQQPLTSPATQPAAPAPPVAAAVSVGAASDSTTPPSPTPTTAAASVSASIDGSTKVTSTTTKDDLAALSEIARFEFKKDGSSSDSTIMPMPPPQTTIAMDDFASSSNSNSNNGAASLDTSLSNSNAILLPDIKEARKKKQMEEELARQQEQEAAQKVRIKRSDKEAFRRLLEQQPFADADDSYFEEEEYGTVSALLGERAKPFLAIPFGPLQVGHFIGSLVFVLMAFIEYPGFPLTSLPSSVRGCFQGGLATIYAINTVLAVIVAIKAPERGQPVPLWAVKTFSVGGLAYDQFMQLPTLAEIEKAKAVKGARANKNAGANKRR